MAKRMSVAEVRRAWAEVLRCAQRGTPNEVTRNGQPIAAVVSIDLLRRLEGPALSEVIGRFRARVRPEVLDGPDPWADVRDRSNGRGDGLGDQPSPGSRAPSGGEPRSRGGPACLDS